MFFLLILLKLLNVGLVLLQLPLGSLFRLLFFEFFSVLLKFFVFLLHSGKHLFCVVFMGLLVLFDFLKVCLEGLFLLLFLLFLLHFHLFNLLFIILQLKLHLLLMLFLASSLIVKHFE